MNAYQIPLISYAFDSVRKQFIIPVYQRNYEWGVDNCSTLLEDILNANYTQNPHFFGTFVDSNQNAYNQGVSTSIIIDGQQRLTSVYILLKALYDLCSDDDTCKNRIKNLLFNNSDYYPVGEDARYRLKLKEVKTDNEQLQLLMSDDFDNENVDSKSNIWINYSSFKHQIQEKINEEHCLIGDFIRGIELLQIVVISLNTPQDDPQIVFERINSTGVRLKLPDQVRNYLLMTDVNMDTLFEDYWLPMEERIGVVNLKDFILEYMYYKLPGDFTEENAYREFKNYMNQNGLTHADVLGEMEKVSKYYGLYLGRYNGNYSATIIDLVKDIQILECRPINPLLFSIFNDFDNHVISEDTLVRMLKFIIDYIVRRTIVDIPTNSMRGFFRSAYKRAFQNSNPTDENYYGSFVTFFLTLNQTNLYDHLLSDNFVIDAVKTKPIYKKSKFCKFLLASLENSGDNNNERVVIDNAITIEHIMPQKLNEWWKEEISYDEVFHDSYMHRLGNLSLTGANSRLSNEAFDIKKTIYSNTRFTYLYQDVLDKENWGREQIDTRAERLAAKIVEIFPLPDGVTNSMIADTDEIIQNATEEVHSLSEEFDYTGLTPVSFIFNGNEYQTNHFRDILEKIYFILYNDDPAKFNEIVNLWNTEQAQTGQRLLFSYNPGDLVNHKEIGNTHLYYEANLNANNIFKNIRKLFEYYEIDQDNMTITISRRDN